MQKTLSIIIPVYNEQATLYKTFESLQNVTVPRGVILEKVIFVDNGSTDTTFQLLTEFSHLHSENRVLSRFSQRKKQKSQPQHQYELEIISYTPTHKKNYAVRQGIRSTQSEHIVVWNISEVKNSKTKAPLSPSVCIHDAIRGLSANKSAK